MKKARQMASRIMSLFLALVMLCTVQDITVFAQDDPMEAEFEVTYCQTEARSMLSMINGFRTGDGAWEWDSTSTQQIVHTDLGELVYDYELEKVAMQRAAELVAAYSHTRPNEKDCFSAYPDAFNSVVKRAENIAIGTGSFPADEAFTVWKEEDEPYSGQGHRRNMLGKDFHTVGIAHVVYNDCHYWVQEFGSSIVGETETAANDSRTEVKVEISPNAISDQTLKLEPEGAVQMGVGESRELPKAYMAVRTEDTWGHAPSLEFLAAAEWSISSGGDVVSISEGKLHALKEGTAVAAAVCSGKDGALQAELQIEVVSAEDSLKKAKTDAKAELQAYAEKLQSQNLYGNTALNAMNMKVVDGNSNIDMATDANSVKGVLIWAKEELDGVEPDKTFDQIKQEAKDELAAYKSDEKESSEQKAQWEKVIADAGTAIDGAENRAAVTAAVSNAEDQIDNLLKAPVTGDDWGLEQVRRQAANELDNYLGKFDPEDYDPEEWADMENIVAQAKLDISTASVQELNTIVPKAKTKLSKVQMKAEKAYEVAKVEMKRKIQEYKDAAIAELYSYRSKYNKYYSKSMVAELEQIIKDGVYEINRVILAEGENVPQQSLEPYERKIQIELARAKSLLEQKMVWCNGAAWGIASAQAIKELENYKNPKDYRTAQQKELKAAIEAGKTAIKKSKGTDGVEAALKAAKAKIDKIKTDAQLKKEEADAPAKTTISGKIKAQKKGFTVKWKKQTKNVDGYEVCYSTSSQFPKKGTVTKTIAKKTTTKLTVKKLKAKKKYYVKVRTYKKVDGTKYVSAWSSVKTVTTKK